MILGETYLEYSGKLKLYGPVGYEILNKMPIGLLRIKFQLAIEPGNVPSGQPNSPGARCDYRLEDIQILLNFGSLPLLEGRMSVLPYNPNLSQEMNLDIKIYHQELQLIESKRADDVLLNLYVKGRYIAVQGSRDIGRSNIFGISSEWKFSQKEWTEFLSKVGYSEKWIIEVDRPKLEGFHEIISHLEKATDALNNKRDPENVIRDLRAAKDSFKTFYDSNKEEIERIIDLGSLGEPNQEPKSKRVEGIYDKITYFLNIGPHNDKYEVTYRDALLAYRQFVTIMSYFSEILIEIKEDLEK